MLFRHISENHSVLVMAWLVLAASLVCAEDSKGTFQVVEPIQLPVFTPFADGSSLPLIAPPTPQETAVLAPEPEVVGPPIEVPDENPIVNESNDSFETPLGIKVSEERLPRKLSNHSLLYREDNTGTEILARGQSGMGLTTIAFASSVLTEGDKNAFWVDPRFEWTFVNGPVQVDLPPQLFELTLACNAVAKTDILDLHFYFAPMLATDFDNYSSDAWRFLGGGMAIAKLSREWQLLGGAIYLDRPDLPIMPHAGALWRPSDNVELDLVVPNPRLAVCFDSEGEDDCWMYCGMNVSGGSWAYERIDSSYDQVGYFDIRAVMGFEYRSADLIAGQWEIGYVFNRRIDLERTATRLDLPDSFVIRWAGSY